MRVRKKLYSDLMTTDRVDKMYLPKYTFYLYKLVKYKKLFEGIFTKINL